MPHYFKQESSSNLLSIISITGKMKTHISSPAALFQDFFQRTSYIGLNAKNFSCPGQDTVYQVPIGCVSDFKLTQLTANEIV